MSRANYTDVAAVASAPALTGLTALELARLVRQRELSAVEVTRAHLDRAEALNPGLGAFVEIRRTLALADAASVDRRRDIGELPLAGVPVAVKDNIDVAGSATRWGSAATPTGIAAEDDAMVARLREAGCVPIGKTNMPELAVWGMTEPRAFGPARNPWDVERTTGGSTGGGAAAVAASLAPLALGSDGGGSLRIPAACCGIVGVKPGAGVVVPSAKLRDHWRGMTQYGPLAFTVDDAAAALAVLAQEPLLAKVMPPRRRLRIAVSLKPPDPLARLVPDVRQAVQETAALLQELGHEIRWEDPPYPPLVNLRWGFRAFAGVAEDAKFLPGGRLEGQTRGVARFGRLVAAAGLAGPPSRTAFAREAHAWLSRFDLLLTPTLSQPAVRLGSWSHRGWLLKALAQSTWVWTLPWSLAQVPGLSIPARVSVDGLPVGIQMVAGPGGEKTLLSVARLLEQVRPWRRPPL